jgi:hypothetical protein
MRSLLTAAGFAAILLTAAPASAQTICGQHADVTKKLETNYKEQPVGMGLSTDGGLIEIYSSEKGTWTILVTRPGGITCLVAAGDNWEAVKMSAPLLGITL